LSSFYFRSYPSKRLKLETSMKLSDSMSITRLLPQHLKHSLRQHFMRGIQVFCDITSIFERQTRLTFRFNHRNNFKKRPTISFKSSTLQVRVSVKLLRHDVKCHYYILIKTTSRRSIN
jgi:hypothetical protein